MDSISGQSTTHLLSGNQRVENTNKSSHEGQQRHSKCAADEFSLLSEPNEWSAFVWHCYSQQPSLKSNQLYLHKKIKALISLMFNQWYQYPSGVKGMNSRCSNYGRNKANCAWLKVDQTWQHINQKDIAGVQSKPSLWHLWRDLKWSKQASIHACIGFTSWTNREEASFSAVSGTVESRVRPWRRRVEIWRERGMKNTSHNASILSGRRANFILQDLKITKCTDPF